MIKKLDLVANIEKYYLGGVVEGVKWNISNKKLYINFVSPHQDLVGYIECDVELSDGVLGIFNTSSLLKLLGILDMDILITIEQQFKTPTKLLIEDSNFSLQYSLADPYVIASSPSIDEPEYETTFNIDAEFITRFSKAKSALGSNTKDICRLSNTVHEDGNKQVKFILGEPTSHSNKIEFTCDASYDEFNTNILPFNSAHIKEILAANKNDIIEAKGYLSMKGLLKLEFTTETGKSTYYLPELRTT
jgi:hypothetical protein